MRAGFRSGMRAMSIVAAICLVVAPACRDGTAPRAERGTLSGRWAGEPWTGEADAVLFAGGASGDTLYLFGTRPPGAGAMPSQTIRVRAVASGVGSYALDEESIEVVNLVGGDGVTSRYVGNGDVAGTLTITGYGGVGDTIVGSLEFRARPTLAYAPYGDVAQFENGVFRAMLHRWDSR